MRWYLCFKLSLRDLLEMMAERGLSLAHTTIVRWVWRYAPEFEKRWKRFAQAVDRSWRVEARAKICPAHFLPEAVMRPSHGCNRLKAFRLYSLSSSTIRLASKRRIQVRVLLVDDDAAIARSIELMLKVEEINIYRTDLGEEGVDLGKIYDYDIILLDLNLPDISGYEVLRSLRSAKVVTPVLILSGLASIEDKIRGLGLGADDYLAKPFHKDELIARIHALVRRSKGHAQSLIAVGDLIVDLEARNVELHGQKLNLTAKEYQILALLALRTGSTLTKETFLNHLYGGLDDEPDAKIIDVFICKLRKKLANASGGQDYIETLWGRGYALREPTKQAIAS
jgi:two-component system, cell cycle response regulator CtrA